MELVLGWMTEGAMRTDKVGVLRLLGDSGIKNIVREGDRWREDFAFGKKPGDGQASDGECPEI